MAAKETQLNTFDHDKPAMSLLPLTISPPACQISQIHFLIHPMYLGDTHQPRDATAKDLTLSAVQARLLGLRYREAASHLPPNNLLFSLTHLTKTELTERNDPYAEYLKGFFNGLQLLLGARFFLETGDEDIFDDYRVGGKLLHDARRRGFQITRETQGRAYGETFLQCVPRASSNLAEAFDFRQHTAVDVRLTDAAFWWRHTDSQGKKYLRSHFRSIGLSIDASLSNPLI